MAKLPPPKANPKVTIAVALPLSLINHLAIGTDVSTFPGELVSNNPSIPKIIITNK